MYLLGILTGIPIGVMLMCIVVASKKEENE